MRVALSVVLGLGAVAACSSSHEPDPGPPSAPVGAPVRGDGGVLVSGFDPAGVHLDDVRPPVSAPVGPNRPVRPIDVTLRSTPPGAEVSVDGRSLGNTPAYWNGVADGREHEFLFQLHGHALARYRFVPVSSGVIHARLVRIAEEPNAGVPPPELVPPGTIPPTAPVLHPVPLAPLADAPAAPGSAVAPAISPGLGPQPRASSALRRDRHR